jgi:Ca-activated chloride channel family protein
MPACTAIQPPRVHSQSSAMMPRRIRPRVSVATLCAIAVCVAALAAQQQPTFKSGARTVAVYATVTDKDGRLVPDLTRDDFEIRDEGKPQPLTVFSNEVQPITVVVMLDRSTSMRGNIRLVEDAAAAFVGKLEAGDKARIGVFAERIEIRPPAFSGDRDELLGILQSGLPVRGPTPLWNAMDDGIAAVREQEGRRVVLVFSDGGNSPGTMVANRTVMDVMRRAQQENVMVYAIGLQTTVILGRSGRSGAVGGMTGSMTSMRPDPSLSMLAEDTGGGYFELTKGENLATTFARVADELHHQYALGFEPVRLDDKMHKLELKVRRNGMKVRARKEYFAAKQ